MLYPFLLIAVRRSGLRQFEIAHRAGIRETRLSRILRDGPASPDERRALARVLDTPADELFAPDDARRENGGSGSRPRAAV